MYTCMYIITLDQYVYICTYINIYFKLAVPCEHMKKTLFVAPINLFIQISSSHIRDPWHFRI